MSVLLLSVAFLTACSKKNDEETLKVAEAKQEQTTEETVTKKLDVKHIPTLAKKLFNVPRGTQAFKEWHEQVKGVLAADVYEDLGIGYFYKRHLPYQESYDKDPTFVDTNFGRNAVGLKADKISFDKLDSNRYRVDMTISQEVGDGTVVKPYEIEYSVELEIQGDKVTKLLYSPFDNFKKLKPLSIEDFEKSYGSLVEIRRNGSGEYVTGDVQQLSTIQEHLEASVKALDDEKYFSGTPTSAYINEFFNGVDDGNPNAYTSALTARKGEFDFSTLTIGEQLSKGYAKWGVYILHKEDKGVVARIEGTYRKENGKPVVELADVILTEWREN